MTAAITLGACDGPGGFPDAYIAPPPPDPGTFTFSWTISDGSGSAITCEDVHATVVLVTIVDEGTQDQDSGSFNCDNGLGFSGALYPGTYDMGFTLRGSGSSAAIATAPDQDGVVIMSQKTAELATVAFTVTTQ